MSKDNSSNDRRESDDQAPNPSPPSQERMNREEEEAQWQKQQQQSANAGDRAAQSHHHHPRDSPNIPPQQQHMMMPPDLRYLQEMRRMEEMMMAAGRGAGGPLVVSRGGGGMHSPRHAAGYSNRWHSEATRAGAAPGGQLPPPGADSVARMPPGGGGIPREDPGTGNRQPSMGLLALLQREQERLMHTHGGPAAGAPESWLPAAKRQRLPPGVVVDPWMVAQANNMGQMMAAAAPHKERKRHVKSFPVKLMETLNGHVDDNVFAWLPDGKSFVVVDPEAFCTNVLTATFKGGKYTSFVRKLNRWGFSRLISGTGMDCFHNSLFQRDQPALCELITSSTERDDTAGVDPALLGSKPSLAGIEKYMEMKDKKEGTFAKLETEESKEAETKQGETADERKRAAVPESSAADADEEEPTNVASV